MYCDVLVLNLWAISVCDSLDKENISTSSCPVERPPRCVNWWEDSVCEVPVTRDEDSSDVSSSDSLLPRLPGADSQSDSDSFTDSAMLDDDYMENFSVDLYESVSRLVVI